MKSKKYKILFLNNKKGSIREINFSKSLVLCSILFLFLMNFLIFSFLADDFTAWKTNQEINSHKKDNIYLVKTINNSKDRISNIEQKLNSIAQNDDNIRDMLKLPKIHEDIRMLGVGGAAAKESFQYLEYLLPESDLNLQSYFDKLDYLDRLANLEVLSYMEMTANTEKNKMKLRHMPAIYPVSLDNSKLTSRFGYRKDPFTKKRKKHEGDDFSAKTGTPVVATADGLVISSKYNGSFGHYIEISHGNGYKTVYGHLSKRDVPKGRYVVRGQKIGEVGNTGKSTAPHLHYEVKHNRKRLDPKDFYFKSS